MLRALEVDEIYFSIPYFKLPSIFLMLISLARDVFNMPIYYLFMWVWVRIFGFGNFAMIFPSIATTICGAVFMVLIAQKISGGGALKYIFLILIFSSLFLWVYIIITIRPYGFVFLFSSATFYFWTTKRRKMFILFLTLSILTHWCFAFLALFYALLDIRKREILHYSIPFLLLLIWTTFCATQGNSGTRVYGFDNESPTTAENFFAPISEMFGFNIKGRPPWKYGFLYGTISLFLFVVGCVFSRGYVRLSAFACLFFWVVVLLSSFIMPASLYRARYFAVILPQVIIVMGFGLYKILIFGYNKINGARIKCRRTTVQH